MTAIFTNYLKIFLKHSAYKWQHIPDILDPEDSIGYVGGCSKWPQG
jgi:hypothetical protein